MDNLLSHRITLAVNTVPNLKDWGITAIIFAIYGIVALVIGLPSQFLQWSPWVDNWPRICLQAFFAPALMEEIGFRVLLLPHATENVSLRTWCMWGAVNLFLFVIYHPLNGLTFYQAGYVTFSDPIFLMLAAFLGAACILAYRLTHSLWPSVVIHWLAVVLWLCCLGGHDRLFA